jgi:hypothetical protein
MQSCPIPRKTEDANMNATQKADHPALCGFRKLMQYFRMGRSVEDSRMNRSQQTNKWSGSSGLPPLRLQSV